MCIQEHTNTRAQNRHDVTGIHVESESEKDVELPREEKKQKLSPGLKWVGSGGWVGGECPKDLSTVRAQK